MPQVLTAAHCFYWDETWVPEDTPIGIGCHTQNCSEGDTIIPSKRIKHPGYNLTGDSEDDFALLVLESSAEGVSLVNLNQNESYPTPDMVSRSMGWGDTSYHGETSDVLLQANLPLLSNAQCYLRNSVVGPTVIGENKLCTYKPGKDTCQGDSGKMILASLYGKITTCNISLVCFLVRRTADHPRKNFRQRHSDWCCILWHWMR
jgi:secreted trypsin-like serine protease